MSDSNIDHPMRLAALQLTGLLDSGEEDTYDRFTRIASKLLDAPVSLVSMVDRDRQFFKSQHGLEGAVAESRETPPGFCQHVVTSEKPLIVTNALEDDRVKDEPVVKEMGVMAYLGVPIYGDTPELPPLGSFCVIDTKPRDWTDEQISLMEDLVVSVNAEIRLTAQLRSLTKFETEALRFTDILNRSQDLVAMGNGETSTLVNVATRIFNGIPLDAPASVATIHTLFPERAVKYLQEVAMPIAIKDGIWTGELPWMHHERGEVLMLMSLMAHLAPDGSVEAFSTIARDISEQVAVRENLTHARKEAESATKAKSSFLANMSHELRTPLNAVLGFSELLGEMVPSKKGKHYLEAIRSSGEALLDIINDILDLSKIESGRLELEQEPVSLASALAGIRLVFGEMAKTRGLVFDTKFSNLTSTAKDPAQDIAVIIDPQRLRQILFNLTSNALKFTSEGGVKLTMSITDNMQKDGVADLRIDVVDSGMGISEKNLKKIFQPFEQGDGAAITEEAGTGLGLTICRRLAKLMGGGITVESELNKGSTFTLVIEGLERVALPDTSENDSETEVSFDRLRRARILAVDDHAFNREVIEGIFDETHHEVFLAKNGIEALKRARELKPDMILMDIRMPGMNGSEANEEIKKDPELSDIPVIAVTASSMRHEARKYRQRFDGYVRKPYTRRQLFATMEQYLAVEKAGETVEELEDVPIEPLAPMKEVTISEAELKKILGVYETDRVIDLRRTYAIREVMSFAQDLQTLGQAARSDEVLEYAGKLAEAVEKFQINRIESLMGKEWDNLRQTIGTK